jgi:hypothetical protein
MWRRHVYFWGLLVFGVGAFGATFLPAPDRPRGGEIPAVDVQSADFQRVVKLIDAEFRAQWQAEGIEPAGRADDLAIARRLSLALTGSIPSLEEVRMIEKVPSDRRMLWWLGHLLEDRRSSNYMGERLARAYVGVNDGPFILFRRRRFVTWLSDQLLANRPMDETVSDLVSSSGLWTDTPQVNFMTATIKPDSEEPPNRSVLATRVTRGFLGMRIDCAECHDHPFEDWKQEDFHGLAAFFGQTNRSAAGIGDGEGEYYLQNRETLKDELVKPAVPFQAELLPAEGSLGKHDRRRRLAAWLTHPENKAFSRAAVNRAWALVFGRALIEPVDDIPQDQDCPIVLDMLADDFASHGFDWQRLLSILVSTQVFQLDSRAADGQELTDAHDRTWAAFPMTRLRPEQVAGAMTQSASVTTIDYQSNIVFQAIQAAQEADFIRRYGDAGQEEFNAHGGTIPQRLLLMNGELLKERTKNDNPFTAPPRIALLAGNDQQAVEVTYLAVLTRRPTADEAAHFARKFENATRATRSQVMEDFYWTLLNSTEFSWNH